MGKKGVDNPECLKCVDVDELGLVVGMFCNNKMHRKVLVPSYRPSIATFPLS